MGLFEMCTALINEALASQRGVRGSVMCSAAQVIGNLAVADGAWDAEGLARAQRGVDAGAVEAATSCLRFALSEQRGPEYQLVAEESGPEDVANMCMAAMLALKNLCIGESREGRRRADRGAPAIPLLVRTLREFPPDHEFHGRVLGCLNNILLGDGKRDSARQELAAAEGVVSAAKAVTAALPGLRPMTSCLVSICAKSDADRKGVISDFADALLQMM